MVSVVDPLVVTLQVQVTLALSKISTYLLQEYVQESLHAGYMFCSQGMQDRHVIQ